MDPTIIIFAALAGFICYRLYTVLGTRGGHEPEEQDEPILRRDEAAASDIEDQPEIYAPPPAAIPAWAEPVREAWPDFDPEQFIYGARAAYEMIVEAYAAGRLDEVRPYIDPGVFRAFEAAVKAREEAGQVSELNFVGIERADVAEARVENGRIAITVDFRSDQTRVLRDAEGEVVEGDPNRIDLVRDRWTFTRPLRSSDPNWILAATGGTAPDAGQG